MGAGCSVLTSLTSVTFSFIILILSERCNSIFLLSFLFRLSTDFSRYSLCRVYSAAMSGSIALDATDSVTCF